MSSSTIKSDLAVIGSQCREARIGVICSNLLVLVCILAAAFCKNWRLHLVELGRPEDSEL